MRNFVKAKAISLLLVFSIYSLLSCVPEREIKESSVQGTINNIKERLSLKDYSGPKVANPFQKLKRESGKIINDFSSRGIGVFARQKHLFQRATYSMYASSTDETLTIGIDDPANFSFMVSELTNYYQGSYSTEFIENSLTDINNRLINYPMNYSGASQLLTDRVNNGAITDNQRIIIEAELEAILNASSASEVLNILNVITQELINSPLSQDEITAILSINAGVEGAIESGAIAYVNNGHIYRQAGAVAIVVFATFAIGAVLFCIGAINNNDTLAGLGLVVGMGSMIGVLAIQ